MNQIQFNIDNRKETETGKSYWDNNGAYQSEYDKMYEDLVPAMGKAETTEGEVLRGISRLTYDYFNNGNGNVIEIETEEEEETCYQCGGSGISETRYEEDEEGESYEVDEECEYCNGSGVLYEEVTSEITIDDYYE